MFELVEGNANTLPVRLADTVVSSDKCCKRDRLGRREGRIPPGSMLHRLYSFAVSSLIFIRRSLPNKLVASLWMLTLA